MGSSISVSGAGEEVGALAASLIVASISDDARREILQWAVERIIERDSQRPSYGSPKVPSMLEQAIAVALDDKIREVAREMVEQGYPQLREKVRDHIDGLVGGLVGDDVTLRARVRSAVMLELSREGE